eukprot:6197026-Pleurochrysis_carterae.AAC.4
MADDENERTEEQLAAEAGAGCGVCALKPTADDVFGFKYYDFRYLCTPSMPWRKGGRHSMRSRTNALPSAASALHKTSLKRLDASPNSGVHRQGCEAATSALPDHGLPALSCNAGWDRHVRRPSYCWRCVLCMAVRLGDVLGASEPSFQRHISLRMAKRRAASALTMN